MFGLQDLFAVGIGFEIAGAWLLARGLLASPAELALRTAQMWNGNPNVTASQIEDRMRGSFGVGSLILGFLLQAMAYGVTVSHDNPSRGTWVGVAICASVPVLAVWLLNRLTWRARLKRLIVAVARYDFTARGSVDRPELSTIVALAEACHWEPAPYDPAEDYARDQFGASRVR